MSQKDASEFKLEYNSVTVFGTVALIESQEEAKVILGDLLMKYALQMESGRDYQAVQEDELSITSVYEIRIEVWSGKQQSSSSEYLDAFDLTIDHLVTPINLSAK